MYYLKQSTASQEVLLGPFVDETDGKTAETGLTIANTDIKIHKAGATTLASKNSGGATHISNGNYYAVLDATDTGTLGSGAIVVQVSGALPFRMEFCVLAANVYDSLIGGGDYLDVSTVQIEGGDATDALAAGGAASLATYDPPTRAELTSDINSVLAKLGVVSSTAQTGSSSTITLHAGASAVDDAYNGQIIVIVAGTGAGQARQVSDYVGATKIADVSPNWAVTPDNTSIFVIIGN